MTILRPATLADAATLARNRIAAWHAAYRGHLPDAVLDAMELAGETDRWTAALTEIQVEATQGSGPHRFALLALDDASTVHGYVVAGPYRDDQGPSAGPGVGEVYAIYVDPPSWGQGYGTRLLTAAAEGLAASGYLAVALWVLESNQAARAFYAARGWALDDAIGHCREAVDAPEVRYRHLVAGSGPLGG